MYVIFYNNKPILLTENSTKTNQFKVFDINSIGVIKVLYLLTNTDLKGVCFRGENINELYQKFTKNFKIIKAAGGLVTNATNNLLFIFRNGVWDLPKGKVEKSESTSQAALREVEEECGISDLKLGTFIDKTYHIYKYKNRFIFKITHWFKMSSNSNTQLKPQIEEGITKAMFLDENGQFEALKNTYANIRLLVESLK